MTEYDVFLVEDSDMLPKNSQFIGTIEANNPEKAKEEAMYRTSEGSFWEHKYEKRPKKEEATDMFVAYPTSYRS